MQYSRIDLKVWWPVSGRYSKLLILQIVQVEKFGGGIYEWITYGVLPNRGVYSMTSMLVFSMMRRIWMYAVRMTGLMRLTIAPVVVALLLCGAQEDRFTTPLPASQTSSAKSAFV